MSSTQFVPTSTLYTAWASTYDHDSNVLQHLDDLVFTNNIVPLLSKLPSSSLVLDLGCGTGRNTIKLFTHLPADSRLIALDASSAMLELAKKRIAEEGNQEERKVDVTWINAGIPNEAGEMRGILGIQEGEGVNVVISTLVLEHLPLDTFFSAVAEILKPGGMAWVTDMHVEMGESRAGFKRNEDGVKLQGESWNHPFEDTVKTAEKYGLKLEEVVEKGVKDEEEAERIGARAKKWAGKRIFLGMRFEKVQ